MYHNCYLLYYKHFVNKPSVVRLCSFMWEDGMTTKPQIYCNSKHASTPQASKQLD